VRLEEWRKFAPALFDAYLLKELFHQIWAARIGIQEARAEYEALRKAIPPNLCKYFNSAQKTIRKCRNEILNCFDYPGITNAFTEAKNGVIRLRPA
jgi:transposase